MKTIIGPETRIAGALYGKDDLEIHGIVEGPVHGEAAVLIAAGARIGGEVRGREVTIAGELSHAVFATALVRLLPTAKVTGDVEAPRVAIDEGAELDGQLRMTKKKAAAAQPAAPASPPAATVQTARPAPTAPAVRAIPELAAPGRKPLIRKSS
jgi:cytoskeletal protein CcmA (bactofilin family)